MTQPKVIFSKGSKITESSKLLREGLQDYHDEILEKSSPSFKRRKRSSNKSKNTRQLPRRVELFLNSSFCQSQYQFVLVPTTPISVQNQILSDSQYSIDWKYVARVIVPYKSKTKVFCPICVDVPIAPRITRCGHLFCGPCISEYCSNSSKSDSGSCSGSESIPFTTISSDVSSDVSSTLPSTLSSTVSSAVSTSPRTGFSNQYFKCPLCPEFIQENDLRPARFKPEADYDSYSTLNTSNNSVYSNKLGFYDMCLVEQQSPPQLAKYSQLDSLFYSVCILSMESLTRWFSKYNLTLPVEKPSQPNRSKLKAHSLFPIANKIEWWNWPVFHREYFEIICEINKLRKGHFIFSLGNLERYAQSFLAKYSWLAHSYSDTQVLEQHHTIHTLDTLKNHNFQCLTHSQGLVRLYHRHILHLQMTKSTPVKPQQLFHYRALDASRNFLSPLNYSALYRSLSLNSSLVPLLFSLPCVSRQAVTNIRFSGDDFYPLQESFGSSLAIGLKFSYIYTSFYPKGIKKPTKVLDMYSFHVPIPNKPRELTSSIPSLSSKNKKKFIFNPAPSSSSPSSSSSQSFQHKISTPSLGLSQTTTTTTTPFSFKKKKNLANQEQMSWSDIAAPNVEQFVLPSSSPPKPAGYSATKLILSSIDTNEEIYLPLFLPLYDDLDDLPSSLHCSYGFQLGQSDVKKQFSKSISQIIQREKKRILLDEKSMKKSASSSSLHAELISHSLSELDDELQFLITPNENSQFTVKQFQSDQQLSLVSTLGNFPKRLNSSKSDALNSQNSNGISPKKISSVDGISSSLIFPVKSPDSSISDVPTEPENLQPDSLEQSSKRSHRVLSKSFQPLSKKTISSQSLPGKKRRKRRNQKEILIL